MSQIIINEQQLFLDRIDPIIDELMEEEPWFQKLTKQQIIEDIKEVLPTVNIARLLEQNQDELRKIMDRVMATIAASGLLCDLTPEEMKIFDEAVEGR